MNQFSFNDVINFCGKTSFNKGRELYLDDFIKLFSQGNAVFGLYRGSVGIYRINIIFESSRISYAWCTCPAMSQYENKCKHIAGLLIHWLESRESFDRLSSWNQCLDNKTKEELIDLIKVTAAKSIDTTNALYSELFDQLIVDYEELFDYNYY